MKYLIQTISDAIKILTCRVILIGVVILLSSAGWISPELMERILPLILV
jgi:hypothetical protein